MALKSIIWKVVRWGGALFFASSILSVILLRFLPVYVTPLMFIRTFQQLGSGESVVWRGGDGQRRPALFVAPWV